MYLERPAVTTCPVPCRRSVARDDGLVRGGPLEVEPGHNEERDDGHGGHEAGGHHGGVVVAAGFVGLAAVVGVTGVGVVLAGGGGYG